MFCIDTKQQGSSMQNTHTWRGSLMSTAENIYSLPPRLCFSSRAKKISPLRTGGGRVGFGTTAGDQSGEMDPSEEEDRVSSSSHLTEDDEDEDEDEDEEYNKDNAEEEEELEEEGDGKGEGGKPRMPQVVDRDRKSQNVAALVRGNLNVTRQPLIPRLLSVSDGAAIARKPFKPPCLNGYSDRNEELARRLYARKRFVPWGSSRPALVTISNLINIPNSSENNSLEPSKPLPPGIEPLVLWQPEESEIGNGHMTPIVVDPLLVQYLRPHQREGVQFMFECVSGLSGADGVAGCILADDMGLGKTLQSITLLYTLLCQGFDGKPMVKRVLIVTPTSLVSNWESEIRKWVDGRIHVLSLCESTRADVVSGIDSFLRPCSPFQVLIISYETFRMHSSKFEKSGSCDLLICDEAHRLKNDQTLINRALAALPCRRRILLSGTPMQNDLEEFFAMVNFTNPGILGDAAYFRRYYEMPIISGREPAATTDERKLGLERSGELSAKVNQFILRRTNKLLSNHLPPKIVEVVCCRLSPLQLQLYYHFIESKNVKRAIAEDVKQSKILAYITALKKLCNHPKLIYDTIKSGSPGVSGFEDCIRFFPPELFSGRSGSWTGGDGVWVELSGKMHVLARLLAQLRQKTDDRIVLVSNYTQTLDLFAQLCRERRYPYLRLDGTTSIGKRQKLVNHFNDHSRDEFAFLLSSKAGGCGLNLIGGNRLVLFDPDWNPANDKQAAARVWRDGQKKRVYIYRFLTTGTIEEKVYQRQMSKEGLQKVIQQEQIEKSMPQGNFLSAEDLHDLFTLHENVRSEIHENMNCIRCQTNSMNDKISKHAAEADDKESEQCCAGAAENESNDIGRFAEISGCLNILTSSEKQIGTPLEEDLGSWGHHHSPKTVPDVILQASAADEVTFVFTNQVDGKLIPVESVDRTKSKGPAAQNDHLLTKKVILSRHLSNTSIASTSNKSSLPTLNVVRTHSQIGSAELRTPTFDIQKRSRNSFIGNRSSPKVINAISDASDDDFQ